MPEWLEEQVVLVSAIEHFSYCPRQYALIHIEKTFDENIFTLRGDRAHERVDTPEGEEEGDKTIERAVPIWSDRLGLQGKTDVVEFWQDGGIYPVEYKHGPKREKIHDDLQLCAQAICLEEMLGKPIRAGAVYYHSSHRRREVVFTEQLRSKTEAIVTKIRATQISGLLPPPVDDGRCTNCSLEDACMPSALKTLAGIPIASRLFLPSEEKTS